MRNEPVACRAIVLIALGKNLAILDDKQSGDALPGEEIVKRVALLLVSILEFRLSGGLGQRRGRSRPLQRVVRQDAVEVAKGPDPYAFVEEPVSGGSDGITLRLAEHILVGRSDRRPGQREQCKEREKVGPQQHRCRSAHVMTGLFGYGLMIPVARRPACEALHNVGERMKTRRKKPAPISPDRTCIAASAWRSLVKVGPISACFEAGTQSFSMVGTPVSLMPRSSAIAKIAVFHQAAPRGHAGSRTLLPDAPIGRACGARTGARIRCADRTGASPRESAATPVRALTGSGQGSCDECELRKYEGT